MTEFGSTLKYPNAVTFKVEVNVELSRRVVVEVLDRPTRGQSPKDTRDRNIQRGVLEVQIY